MTEPVEVQAQPLETLIFTTPRPGHPPPSQGTAVRGFRQLIARVSPACADELERELRRMQRDVKGGRLRVWRYPAGAAPGQEREINPPRAPGADEDVDEDVGAATLTAAASPLEASQAQLAAVRAETERRERELASVRDEIARLKGERAREVAETTKIRDTILAGVVATIDRANAHAEAQLTKAWKLDEIAQDSRLRMLTQHAESLERIVTIRERGDSLMLKEGVADMLKSAKDLVLGVFESPVGQVAGMQVSAFLAAQVASAMGLQGPDAARPDIQASDAIRGLTIQGAQHRNRCALIEELAAIEPGSPVAQGARLALQVAEGKAELSALAELVKAHKPGAEAP